MIGKLVGNHKASITCLLTLPSKAAFKLAADQQQPTVKGSKPAAAGKADQSRAAAAAAAVSPPVVIPSVDLVLGGDSSGALWVWEPFKVQLGSPDREIGPRMSWTGHAAEVWAACLTPGPEDPELAAAKVFTSGIYTVQSGPVS